MGEARTAARGVAWVRAHLVGAVAVTGFLVLGCILAVPAIGRYRADHLGGQTRRITLAWQCWNHIQWDQPGTSWTWVGPFWDEPPSNLPTSTSEPVDPRWAPEWPVQRAAGEIHFDSHDHATFTSDAGGRVRLGRVERPFFSRASCSVR